MTEDTIIQISNFEYVKRAKNLLGYSLRFTFALSIPYPNGKRGEMAVDGCLAQYNKAGELRWSMPINRYSATTTQQLHWINPTLYNTVYYMLTTQGKEFLPKLISPLQKLLKEECQMPDTMPKILESVLE